MHPTALYGDAGQTVSGAITAAGEVYLWGSNTMGQLGKGDDESDSTIPTRLKATKKMAETRCLQVSFGGQHTLLLVTSTAPPPPPPAPAAVPDTADAGAPIDTSAPPADAPAPAAAASKKRKAEDDEAGPSTAAPAESVQPEEAGVPPAKKAKVDK
jgi:hypothetical protein